MGNEMDSEFRELTPREKALLERLLDAAIHSNGELRTQLNHVKGKQVIEDGTLNLQCGRGMPASGKYLPVAEGMTRDADGRDIAVILHLGRDGFMTMLEIIKYDGSPIVNAPTAEELVLLMPESPGQRD